MTENGKTEPTEGEVPENANERKSNEFHVLLFGISAYRIIFSSWFSVSYREYRRLMNIFFAFTLCSDCPGTQSEAAGKSEACKGCPNQEVCATAPKGPDPGIRNHLFIWILS